MKLVRFFLIQLMYTFVFLASVEFIFYSLRFFITTNKFDDRTQIRFLKPEDVLTLSKFSKDNFCDVIHLTDAGHKLFAKCQADEFRRHELKLAGKTVFAFGGSTTEGNDCNSTTKWTSELETHFPQTKIFNYGKASNSSSYDLKLLSELLESGKRPDVVLWGNWINELFANSNVSNSNKLQFTLLKIYNTAYRYSNFCRFVSNSANENLNSFSGFDAAALFFEQGEKALEYYNQVSSKDSSEKDSDLFRSSIANYEKNALILRDLSIKYGFRVVIQIFPYIENFYESNDARLNKFLMLWIRRIQKSQIQLYTDYQFAISDVNSCFIKTAQN